VRAAIGTGRIVNVALVILLIAAAAATYMEICDRCFR
jgi:hypothetical protein